MDTYLRIAGFWPESTFLIPGKISVEIIIPEDYSRIIPGCFVIPEQIIPVFTTLVFRLGA